MRAALVLLGIALVGVGCSKAVDKYLVKHPIAQALESSDVELVCTSAQGNVPMASGVSTKRPPRRALAILQLTSAVCSELDAMEAEIDAERAWFTLEGDHRVVEVTDARERARRARAITAARLEASFQHVQAQYGVIGEACPKLRRTEDEFTYLLGLVAGASALLQDQASGGEQGVTTDRLGKIGRAAACLDDDRWFYVPAALRAGGWAMVPGSGPDEVDPWQALDRAAQQGEASGLRIARAMQIQVAANAGRRQIVADAIQAFAAVQAEPDPTYRMLDAQAERIVGHQADLIWVKARGHRAKSLGPLPTDAPEPAADDPFADDPFADDPFADDADGDPDPDPEPKP